MTLQSRVSHHTPEMQDLPRRTMLPWYLSPRDLQHPFAGWPNKPMSPLSACLWKPKRFLLVELLKAHSSSILEKLFFRHLWYSMGSVTFWVNPLLHRLQREARVSTLFNWGVSAKDWKLGELNMDHKPHNCAAGSCARLNLQCRNGNRWGINSPSDSDLEIWMQDWEPATPVKPHNEQFVAQW